MHRMLPAASLCLGLLATPSAAQAGEYAINQGRTQLYVQVYKDPTTTAAGLSHNHVMAASGWTGSLSYDTETHACSLSISLPVSRLLVDEPQLRSQVGYDGVLADDQREDVKKNMLSESQLNAAAHPNITFQSTSCDGSTMTGTLTIRGKTKTVTAKYKAEGSDFVINDKVQIRASEFGFQPYSALFGQLKNKDEMDITIRLVAAAK